MDNNTKLELKLEAFRQSLHTRVSNLTLEYEEKIADLRVELTLKEMELNEARGRIEAYEEALSEKTSPSDED